jgi:hypothetical protein
MGKYTSHQAPPPVRPYEIHPVWRGIGCIMLILGPVIAFAAAHLIMDENLRRGWYPIPREFMNTFVVPGINYPLGHFYATLVLTGVILVLGFGLLMLVYSIVYGIAGPGRNPMDAPPVRERPVTTARHRK